MTTLRIIASGLLVLLGTGRALGQAAPTAPLQLTAKAEYDSFFGLYPSLSVGHSLDSLRQLTAYGTCYTQPGSVGLELGAGFSVTQPRLRLTLVPSIGVLSGSFFGPGRGFLVGEGYTASVAAQRDWARLSGAAVLGYYGLLRQKTPDVYDIAFYHVEVGCKLNSTLTIGVLHEQILSVRQKHNESNTSDFALWRVGLFGRSPLPGGMQAELAGGWLNGGFVRAGLSRVLGRPKGLASALPPGH